MLHFLFVYILKSNIFSQGCLSTVVDSSLAIGGNINTKYKIYDVLFCWGIIYILMCQFRVANKMQMCKNIQLYVLITIIDIVDGYKILIVVWPCQKIFRNLHQYLISSVIIFTWKCF